MRYSRLYKSLFFSQKHFPRKILQVETIQFIQEQYKRRYTQIKGFHYISSITNEGIDEMIDEIISVTLQEPYMNEKIPTIWLGFEELLLEYGQMY